MNYLTLETEIFDNVYRIVATSVYVSMYDVVYIVLQV